MKKDKTESAVPEHVAIIMDGNGRWAKERGWSRLKGHEEGAESVRVVVDACRKVGVKYLTLYAFSVENWVRPKAEIAGLMKLLDKFLTDREKDLHENDVRLRVTGRIEDLPLFVRRKLLKVMEATKDHKTGQLILALSYGGRTEIANAAKQIALLVKDGKLDPTKIDETTVAEHLYLPDVPDPDLMIRTSGEMRLSNFLLWQLSYAEFYISQKLWPDFREPEFLEAIEEYKGRRRRFGDVK
ncbi:MAG: isoprenyl transferase [Kiritimatiellae bacterium]|nr:isoprenyl transferase [Kiritimatiellia bacterium]